MDDNGEGQSRGGQQMVFDLTAVRENKKLMQNQQIKSTALNIMMETVSSTRRDPFRMYYFPSIKAELVL